MKHNHLQEHLREACRDYWLSDQALVRLEPDFEHRYNADDTVDRVLVMKRHYYSSTGTYLSLERLSPADLVKLAEVTAMLRKWESGEIAELPPSNCRRMEEIWQQRNAERQISR